MGDGSIWRRCGGGWLAALCVALGSALLYDRADAQAQTASGATPDRAAMIAEVVSAARRAIDNYLNVPKEWLLDDALRQAGQAAIDSARPRLQAVLSEWAEELYATLPSQPGRSASSRTAELFWALDNRLYNETALNLLDTEGPAHDGWRSQVATTAGWCRQLWQPAVWAEVLLAIERLPQEQRRAALEHERQVLARWGRPRPALPPRPAFSLDAHASRLLARVQQGTASQRPPVAMVPVVAHQLLRDEALALAGTDAGPPPHRAVRCAGLQWALANARAERVAEPAVLDNAFRHALMPRVQDLPRATDDTSPNAQALLAQGWPLHVARREVTGPVQVRVQWDAQGRVVGAEVISRRLTAPGLAGRRPAAFETALDDASLAKARTLAADGRSSATIEMVWKLTE